MKKPLMVGSVKRRMPNLVPPHGGRLIARYASKNKAAELLRDKDVIPQITLSAWNISDLKLIAGGALSPLEGFMTKADYLRVIKEMRLADGTLWSLPVTLAVDRETANTLSIGTSALLNNETGKTVGVLNVQEIFEYDKEMEANLVYRTTDIHHPGVGRLFAQGPVLIGGPIWVTDDLPSEFPNYDLDPLQTRNLFEEKGWQTVVGFQTRNPIHRAHEYIQKCALEIVDGLLVHPLVGETKADDIPAEIRLASYEALLANYYPTERTCLTVFPASMRYAGPREAVFHAIVRKNYGCSHFIVGRDHAGVGNYYGTYEAQQIFKKLKHEELGITPLFFDHTFYCKLCGNMASSKTCPHDISTHLNLSGTKVRKMLRTGQDLPVEFTRPEVAKILVNGLQDNL